LPFFLDDVHPIHVTKAVSIRTKKFSIKLPNFKSLIIPTGAHKGFFP